MYVITNKQIKLFEASMREKLVEKLFLKFNELKPVYLPTTVPEIKAYLHLKIVESKKWGLENDELIEKYIYLCLSYEKLNSKEIPKKYVTILTWPSRSGDDKLKYLHYTLIQDHHVTKSK
ncbi:MAG: hypothetical protein NTW54_11085 [Bacteroidetes bacterium]|nr:hypothetical protein [Bacteroidota bacterium]